MNICGNNQTNAYLNQTGSINISGNGNKIQVRQCDVILGVMGNNNTVYVFSSKVQTNVSGNNNVFVIENCSFTIGINGNNNQVKKTDVDHLTEFKISYQHGNGNKFPQFDNRNQQGVYQNGGYGFPGQQGQVQMQFGLQLGQSGQNVPQHPYIQPQQNSSVNVNLGYPSLINANGNNANNVNGSAQNQNYFLLQSNPYSTTPN